MSEARLPLDRILNHSDYAEKRGLEPFSGDEAAEMRSAIAKRIYEAYDTNVMTDIAERVGMNLTTVRLYLNGSRFPSIEFLYQSHRVTGVSIHWLVTGEGPRFTTANFLFSPEEELDINLSAKLHQRSFFAEVRHLTRAALKFLKEI